MDWHASHRTDAQRVRAPGNVRQPGKTGAVISNLALGQVISFFISGASIAAASLSDRGMNFPVFMSFIVYLCLCGYLVRVRRPLRLPVWRYAVYALMDVEANFLVVLSITSVMLLDCFSIPVAMLMSRLFLDARYTSKHLLGVLLCLVGLALTVINDLEDKTAMKGHSFKGDLLCLGGAFLYGCLNVMQESIVKKHDRSELLGMTGAFGVLFAGVQFLILERGPMQDMHYSHAGAAFVLLYVGSIFCMYTWTSIFLQAGDAALFNLGLLTSDLYGMVFAYFVEKQSFDLLYIVAFFIIISGLFVYHGAPSATAPGVAKEGSTSPRPNSVTDDSNGGPGFSSLEQEDMTSEALMSPDACGDAFSTADDDIVEFNRGRQRMALV
ncbi:hypothetical protein JKP88DRAFT_281000 [Tribonema minus]|uniref:Solute carrier family 35 member F1 n=1 Tax=Tribonema minus TaxID=303371 RepID=A0A836CB98_9STRA|nr:hypothetical protein JKP88DRAFT_281000 [Tribonema minus]